MLTLQLEPLQLTKLAGVPMTFWSRQDFLSLGRGPHEELNRDDAKGVWI
jgi:hypothetical protein